MQSQRSLLEKFIDITERSATPSSLWDLQRVVDESQGIPLGAKLTGLSGSKHHILQLHMRSLDNGYSENYSGTLKALFDRRKREYLTSAKEELEQLECCQSSNIRAKLHKVSEELSLYLKQLFYDGKTVPDDAIPIFKEFYELAATPGMQKYQQKAQVISIAELREV